MPRDTREPQSYGSGQDWQTGRTDQQVHDPKAAPPAQHAEFYDESRDAESSDDHANQGGSVSPVQMAENEQRDGDRTGGNTPVQKVTAKETGAKRDSYFKKRDYE